MQPLKSFPQRNSSSLPIVSPLEKFSARCPHPSAKQTPLSDISSYLPHSMPDLESEEPVKEGEDGVPIAPSPLFEASSILSCVSDIGVAVAAALLHTKADHGFCDMHTSEVSASKHSQQAPKDSGTIFPALRP
ncbi:hypothetical protein B0H67DRAFT_324347 [Lasiosphaeris hirsuta]|uniref:Uncharacterized protein n=1 Tax=Lasiosphaeris hirsuta TaxID=260670 RepID=A0AA40A273_9PEZI|nr:hypothetical protein B0H67DRAFT_324347 [Lasiosphaeris hirsuta]